MRSVGPWPDPRAELDRLMREHKEVSPELLAWAAHPDSRRRDGPTPVPLREARKADAEARKLFVCIPRGTLRRSDLPRLEKWAKLARKWARVHLQEEPPLAERAECLIIIGSAETVEMACAALDHP